MMQKIKEFFDEKGQGIVEYGIVLAVVAAIAFAAFGYSNKDNGLQNKITTKFENAKTNIDAVGSEKST